MNSIFIVWRDPKSTLWKPVAKLTEQNGVYRFAYTRGALNSRFVAFPRMGLLTKEYVSTQLFPFFQNRLIPDRRPEYFTMLSWLDMVPGENDPLDILSVSGGAKKTDGFRIVKVPQNTSGNEYRIKFFISGVAYASDLSKHEILSLEPDQELLCVLEAGNQVDANAVSIVSSRTGNHLGYYPGYLNQDVVRINRLLGSDRLLTKIKVVKVNSSAPEQYRLLCESITPWPEGFAPFQTEEYQLLSSTTDV